MSKVLNLNVGPVFKVNFDAVQSGKYRIVCNQGGTRSGKTYNIIIMLIVLCMSIPGLAVSVVSESLPHLKRGAIKDFLSIMNDAGAYSEKNHNRTDNVYKFGNGSTIEFFSADDSRKLRGSTRDILFINECDLISYDSFKQLDMRTKRAIVIDYNPADQFHWIYDKIIPRSDCKFIQSTYLDNYDFLPAEQIQAIERMKDEDPDYWTVYGLGERGSARELIYSNYRVVDISQFPTAYDWTIYGQDFGYNNPSAMVQVGCYDSDIYVRQKIYESGLTNEDLIKRYFEIDIPKTTPIYCDSAEPQRIEEMFRAGFNAKPSDKSVKDGIDYVRRQKVFICNEDVELIKEFRMYKFKVDKDGRAGDEPVKMNDHLMDAVRYALYTNYLESTKPVPNIRWL